MEFIFELLLEFILEGSLDISKNKKISKIIRYPFIVFLVLLFLGVILLIFYTEVLTYQKINKICGILLIMIGIVFFVASIIKFKKLYLEKAKKKNKQEEDL